MSRANSYDLVLLAKTSVSALNPVAGWANRLSAEDKYKTLAWIERAKRPEGPYGVLVLQGGKWSGKTNLLYRLVTAVELVERLLSPMPRTEHGLVEAAAAAEGRILAIDDAGTVTKKTAEALCQLAMRGAGEVRMLRTNKSVAVPARPVAIAADRFGVGSPTLARHVTTITLLGA